jgi:hypothetical protein
LDTLFNDGSPTPHLRETWCSVRLQERQLFSSLHNATGQMQDLCRYDRRECPDRFNRPVCYASRRNYPSGLNHEIPVLILETACPQYRLDEEITRQGNMSLLYEWENAKVYY